MPTAEQIPIPVPGQPPGTVAEIPNPADLIPGASQVKDLGQAAAATSAWLANRHNLVRVAWTAVGLVLIVAGVLTIGGRPVAAAATKATATAAKIVK